MDVATIPDLRTVRELAEWPFGATVSVYVPLDPSHRDIDRVALKASLQWAEARLTDQFGIESAAAAQITAIASMPNVASLGTVVWYLAEGRSKCVTLPVAVPASATVGAAPDVLGLLPYLDSDSYFVLALSQHRVRLFRAGRYRIEPVAVPDLPRSLEEALWFVRREPTFERHGSGSMHAAGSGREWHKDDLHRFVQLIDEAVMPVVRVSNAPLLVMGVGYEAAMFVNASRYRHVVREPVEGNPDSLEASEVHARSWTAMQDRVWTATEVVSKARALLGTGLAVTDPAELLVAAERGEVGTLAVSAAASAVRQGHHLLGGPRHDLCRTVLWSAAAGAAVHVVPSGDLPGGADAVALLRR